jgi:pimeloyl-ACP methyl ester carboxylesterase
MHPALNLIASVTLALASVPSAGPPGEISPAANHPVGPTSVAPRVAAPTAMPSERATVRPGFHYEPIGLSLLRPYARGKVPVVFINGLGATPESWAPMIEGFEADPIIRRHYQFWTFGYATGEPILYSASLLRASLRQARERYDPARTDAAFDRMVLIGHSMGGILAKVMAEDSRSVLWDTISSQPVDKLLGPAEARETLRQSFFFDAVPEVRRIVYIATPHRGSRVNQGALRWLGSRLNHPLDNLRRTYESLLASNDPEFFHKPFRDRLSSSVDQLAWEHPRLMALLDLRFNPGVKFHSIIADINNPPGAGGTDGVVDYVSSHFQGASSELIVRGGHLCQANPFVKNECERILKEHLASAEHRSNLAELGIGKGASTPLSGQTSGSGQPARSDRSRASAQASDRAGPTEFARVAR